MEQLLLDWYEHFFSTEEKYKEDAPFYYMGAVLFYKNKTKFDVIDGQQRITTLLLIDQFINDSNSYLNQNKWDLNYNSLLSSANIKINYSYLRRSESLVKIKDFISSIFEKLIFTIIITNSEDDAFTFFDSQNNRGVSLGAVDFLKSYHLRELKDKIDIQTKFVKQWDSNNANQFLDELFSQTLWRSRNWKGKNIQFENKDLILKNFQKDTYKEDNNDQLKLYSNVNNRFASSLIYDAKKGILMQLNPLSMQLSPALYPFALRQPIQKGIGFFLYAEKYYSLYELLFDKKEVPEVIEVLNTLVQSFNSYFKSFFKLAVVIYYDKFKEEKVFEFALWLDFLLGSLRVNQATIVAQTPVKILRDSNQNFFDVIELAYRPEEIFEFIRKLNINGSNINYFYGKEVKDYGAENGVRNQYRKDNLVFYKNQNLEIEQELTNKKRWIYERLKK
ncbi:DUF262 domain-containing protein [Chryseobacterium sp. 3008163]|uniref:DUF262 domain-containing protein n=1 Tax=Chryseobacterium sp. 3008163 TaxID=2478663 RepID=UPI0021CF378B|nr:DUF262 domain-containing protein [Chryseobacterium sp. 3008163]